MAYKVVYFFGISRDVLRPVEKAIGQAFRRVTTGVYIAIAPDFDEARDIIRTVQRQVQDGVHFLIIDFDANTQGEGLATRTAIFCGDVDKFDRYREDAERYRWLRKRKHVSIRYEKRHWLLEADGVSYPPNRDIDAVIDNAKSKEQK